MRTNLENGRDLEFISSEDVHFGGGAVKMGKQPEFDIQHVAEAKTHRIPDLLSALVYSFVDILGFISRFLLQ